MAFLLKGIGDALNQVNEISPRFDAKILNFLGQCEPGVCWNEILSRFNISSINRGVRIGAGMVQANGYYGMSDTAVDLNVIIPASTQFAMVIAEINLAARPQRFQVRLTNQSASSSIPLTRNNLFLSPSGIHQIPLYLLTIQPSGIITWSDQRVQLSRPQNVQHANNANHSTSATNLTGSGTIATTTTTTTATRTTNSTRIANTAFVHAVVDWANRVQSPQADVWYGHITLPNGLIIQWHEVTSQSITFVRAFPDRCFFVGFVGNWGSNLTSDNHTARTTGIDRATVTRTGFRWFHQSSATRVNQRRFLAMGW